MVDVAKYVDVDGDVKRCEEIDRCDLDETVHPLGLARLDKQSSEAKFDSEVSEGF